MSSTQTEASLASFAPIPMSFARSSLFVAAERATGHVENLTLQTARNCGITATYTGPVLTQQHAMIWQALIRHHRAHASHIDEPVRIRQADLLRAIGRTDTSTDSCRQLWKKLKQLQQALLELRTPKHTFSGQLLGTVVRIEVGSLKGMIVIHLNPMLASLLGDEIAHIDLDRKLSLGRHQVAAWLHDYISTQSNTKHVPVPVEELHKLSGSRRALPQFRWDLREAIDLLKNGEHPLLLPETHINPKTDMLVYNKNPTKVTWISGGHIERKLSAQDRALLAEQEALSRRGRVAL